VGNYLSLAAVTSTLQTIMQRVVPTDISDCQVRAIRPEKASEGAVQAPSINLYLYQVNPNPNRSNEDLATRSNGKLVRTPRVALDLYYMVSFYGDETELVPQRLLGSVVSYLHANPYLDRRSVERTLRGRAFLKDSDLIDSLQEMNLTLMTMNLEEFSRVWSGFFPHVPYTLSLIYKVSVVMIESSEKPPGVKRVEEVHLNTSIIKQPDEPEEE